MNSMATLKPYLVLRIAGDGLDTYAVPYRDNVGEAVSDALDIALPDHGDIVEWTIVSAPNIAAARLAPKRSTWRRVSRHWMQAWHGDVPDAFQT
jgi:hypothetical protein